MTSQTTEAVITQVPLKQCQRGRLFSAASTVRYSCKSLCNPLSWKTQKPRHPTPPDLTTTPLASERSSRKKEAPSSPLSTLSTFYRNWPH